MNQIGKGTNGTVYKAINRSNGRIVAVKVIEKSKTKYNKGLELRIMLSARHPNIVNLIESFESRSTVYLVMELMQTSLAEYLKIKGPLNESASKTVF